MSSDAVNPTPVVAETEVPPQRPLSQGQPKSTEVAPAAAVTTTETTQSASPAKVEAADPAAAPAAASPEKQSTDKQQSVRKSRPLHHNAAQLSTTKLRDDKDHGHLLSVNPTERAIALEEYELHRERLEAINGGRSASQATTQLHASQRKVSPTRNEDPVVRTHHDNHKKALSRIMSLQAQRLPLVAISQTVRMGNLHAPNDEFVDPRHPSDPLSARDRRMRQNPYRSGRLIQAERVDEENVKIVTALIQAKSVVPTTQSLLQQERERQSVLRRIERGPSSSAPNSGKSSLYVPEDTLKKEQLWNNRISPFVPHTPPVTTIISSKEQSSPRILWEEKIAQAREMQKKKLLASSTSAGNNNESASKKEIKDAAKLYLETTKSPSGRQAGEGGNATKLKPRPPPAPLEDCIEKIPEGSIGRVPNQPIASVKHVKSKVAENIKKGSPRKQDASQTSSPKAKDNAENAAPHEPAAQESSATAPDEEKGAADHAAADQAAPVVAAAADQAAPVVAAAA